MIFSPNTLLNIKQYTIGQFICSMRGYHTISDIDEDRLYQKDNDNSELLTTCNLCGIRVIAKIEQKLYGNVYKISRYQEPD